MEWNRSESERVGHDRTTPVPALRRAHRGAEGAGGRRCLEHLRSRTGRTGVYRGFVVAQPRSVRHWPRRDRGVFAPEVEARLDYALRKELWAFGKTAFPITDSDRRIHRPRPAGERGLPLAVQ